MNFRISLIAPPLRVPKPNISNMHPDIVPKIEKGSGLLFWFSAE
jgi:hypothetical protein